MSRWGKTGAGFPGGTKQPSARLVLAPTGPDRGEVFHLLFGLRPSVPNDVRLFEAARPHVDDDIALLREAGLTVVLVERATRDDFVAAITGAPIEGRALASVGLLWLAHGHRDGGIDTADGGRIVPGDVDPARVPASLRLVIFAACYVGAQSTTWRTALGGRALVVGWGRPVTLDRTVDFLTPRDGTHTDLDDLLQRFVLVHGDLPASPDTAGLPPPASSRGRLEDLETRLAPVFDMLNAHVERKPNGVELDVPLPDGRFHTTRVFVCDSAEPFLEGELLLGVEAEVGELTHVVDATTLLSQLPPHPLAKVTLVRGDAEVPHVVTQGFLPAARASLADLASLVFQVARHADALERRIFGGDLR